MVGANAPFSIMRKLCESRSRYSHNRAGLNHLFQSVSSGIHASDRMSYAYLSFPVSDRDSFDVIPKFAHTHRCAMHQDIQMNQLMGGKTTGLRDCENEISLL